MCVFTYEGAVATAKHCTQIGEISIMKEITNVANTMMTEEEREELDQEMKAEAESKAKARAAARASLAHSASAAGVPSATASPNDTFTPPTTSRSDAADIRVTPASLVAEVKPADSADAPPSSTSLTAASTPTPDAASQAPESDKHPHHKSRDKKHKQKMTPEQRKKLEEMDKARREAMEARVVVLAEKLLERIRPFVEAQKPGDPDDAETKAFISKMEKEAEDLKLESFGIEVCQVCFLGAPSKIPNTPQILHTVGTIYLMKATTYMKSRKLLGMFVESKRPLLNVLIDLFQPWVFLASQREGNHGQGCLGGDW